MMRLTIIFMMVHHHFLEQTASPILPCCNNHLIRPPSYATAFLLWAILQQRLGDSGHLSIITTHFLWNGRVDHCTSTQSISQPILSHQRFYSQEPLGRWWCSQVGPILMLQNGSQFVNGLTVGAHRTLDPSLNRGAVQILINWPPPSLPRIRKPWNWWR